MTIHNGIKLCHLTNLSDTDANKLYEHNFPD